MGRRNNWIYVLFAIVFVFMALSFIFIENKSLQVIEYDVKFIVDAGGIGLDTDNSLLTFGQVNAGGGARRNIIVGNSYEFPISVEFLVSKNLAGLVHVEGFYEGIVVESGKNITIPVKLDVPFDFELGNYSGKARIEIYRFKE